MKTMQSTTSEVAQLVQQIALEYEAAKRGLSGLASGVVQHQFTTAKLEQIGELHEALATLVGAEQAGIIGAETLEQAGSG
jgi:hypothetical protein